MKLVLTALACLLLATTANAAERYRVELLIFAYFDEESARHEHWQDFIEEPESDLVDTNSLNTNDSPSEQEDINETLIDNAQTQPPLVIPVTGLEFADAAKRFRYRSDISVVWHKAWIEEMQDADNAIVHEVSAELENGIRIEVSGSVSLHKSRFIHLTPNLKVQQYVWGMPQPKAVIDPIGKDSDIDTTRPDKMTFNELVVTGIALDNPTLEKLEPQWLPLRAAHLTRSRRMRSDELHYLDHPLLGIVVKVTEHQEPEKETTEEAAASN